MVQQLIPSAQYPLQPIASLLKEKYDKLAQACMRFLVEKLGKGQRATTGKKSTQ